MMVVEIVMGHPKLLNPKLYNSGLNELCAFFFTLALLVTVQIQIIALENKWNLES